MIHELVSLVIYRFHILSSHSPKVAAIGNQLDYLGVVLLMWGATIPTLYYGFIDDRKLQILYCSVVPIIPDSAEKR